MGGYFGKGLFALALLALPGAALAQMGDQGSAPDHAHPASPPDTSPPATPLAEALHPGEAHNHADMLVPKVPTLLEGYGGGGFAVTTAVPQAQAFFSNAMELDFAFAHRASVEAAREAVRLDPTCAMCLWAQALTDGPTINYGKDAAERRPLYALVRRAAALAKTAGTERERALIAALAVRYRPGKVEARDDAYTAAMIALAARYPLDNEIAVLAADAVLEGANTRELEQPAGVRAMALLEPVLARAPDHTPAIHFYIHASEIARQPAKAESSADRLGTLAPRASHLVHMPSHTYFWVGRYQDAADVNARAVEIGKANAARLGLPAPLGEWDLPYHAHNVIFGLGGALMAGDSRTALMLGRPLVERSAMREDAGAVSQLLAAAGYFALARFEDPAVVLVLPEPKLPYLKAAWHYARGEAFAFRHDDTGLAAEIAAIPDKIAPPAQRPGEEADADPSKAPDQMLGIVKLVLQGRAAMIAGKPADAATAYAAAAIIEESDDFSRFNDPPAFWYPVRRDYAAALLASGDKAGATREIAASLRLRPHDPVALALLAGMGD